MPHPISIGQHTISTDSPAYIIAEISCNHEGDYEEALRIINAAHDAGADAVKIQTYTADTISRRFGKKADDTMWSDIDLYSLYEKAQTPWDWSKGLKEHANKLGMDFFSSPFDETAVDFLVNELDVPVLKVASFEVVDTKLLEKMAKTNLPIIMSNGMTDFIELDDAVSTLRANGCTQLALLHCNSGYPARFDEANLKTIQAMQERYDVTVGLSDHTLFADENHFAMPMAHVTPLESVKLGAKIIEVHLMLDRTKARALYDKNEGGFDWAFSREPHELKTMIDMIRRYEAGEEMTYASEAERSAADKTHGKICFEPTEKELNSRKIRPSLWVVKNMKKGDTFRFAAEDKKQGNFDSIRPADGLPVKHTNEIEGQVSKCDIDAGTPLNWDMIDD